MLEAVVVCEDGKGIICHKTGQRSEAEPGEDLGITTVIHESADRGSPAQDRSTTDGRRSGTNPRLGADNLTLEGDPMLLGNCAARSLV